MFEGVHVENGSVYSFFFFLISYIDAEFNLEWCRFLGFFGHLKNINSSFSSITCWILSDA